MSAATVAARPLRLTACRVAPSCRMRLQRLCVLARMQRDRKQVIPPVVIDQAISAFRSAGNVALAGIAAAALVSGRQRPDARGNLPRLLAARAATRRLCRCWRCSCVP